MIMIHRPIRLAGMVTMPPEGSMMRRETCRTVSKFPLPPDCTERMGTMFKYYKSVTVQPGDSLWSIAADNMSEEYDSIQDYIDEVCFINSLSNTCIHAGKNLTIPYYSAEFK